MPGCTLQWCLSVVRCSVAFHPYLLSSLARNCPCISKKDVAEGAHQTAPQQARAGELGAQGEGGGRGSALPSVVPSCSARPEEQNWEGDGDRAPAQPSGVRPQLRAAGGNTTVTPAPGALAALRALVPPGLDLHRLCRLSTCRQDPALPGPQEKGLALMLFCNMAEVSGSPIYVSYNIFTAAFHLGL